MENKVNIAVLIVNWNGKKYLKDCIKSLNNQTYGSFSIWIVDNGSNDDSVKYISKEYPEINLIRLSKNYGFAKGNNIGIKKIMQSNNIEYIICLNNDTILDSNWLKNILKPVSLDERVGIVSSKAYFEDGNIQSIGFRSSLNLFVRMALVFDEPDSRKWKVQKEIYAPAGVAMLLRVKMIKEIGMFDESFFAYAEDLDLGIRAQLFKWKCIFQPDAKLIHLHSKTGGASSFFKAFHIERNSYFVGIKNFPLSMLLFLPFYNIKVKLDYFFKKEKSKSVEKLKSNIGTRKIFWIVLKSHLEVLYYMPEMLKKRYEIQKNKKITNKEFKNIIKKFL